MRDHITEIVAQCPTFQKKIKDKKSALQKKQSLGHIVHRFDRPYAIWRAGQKSSRKGENPLTVKCCTMIDPATGWLKITQYKEKNSISIANLITINWLSRYPLPDQVIFDQDNEFIGHELRTMIIRNHGIKIKPTTVQ
jgi:hypothetical protein